MILKSFFLSALLMGAALTAAAHKHTRHVDPFIGTAATGHTFPGATVPFGLVQPGPSSGVAGWKYCSGYIHSDARLWGFAQTHLNGTGCTDLGDLLIMPVSRQYAQIADTAGVAQSNDKVNLFGSRKGTETARPGYYAVELLDAGVRTEATATPHVAYYRHTFQPGARRSVYIDLQHGPTWTWEGYRKRVKECEFVWDDAQTLSGHIRSEVWVDKDVYFVISFSQPMTRFTSLNPIAGFKGSRLLVDFPDSGVLEMKVALSTHSVAGARRNLAAELPGWQQFDQTAEAADAAWEQYLSRIDIAGTEEQMKMFYTSFYHALIQPNNIADVDGSYRNTRREEAKAVDGTEMYSTLSLWDTYRAAHPLYTLVTPEKVGAFVNSMIAQGEDQGFLPIWALWGKETQTMIGNHAVSVIAEAYAKGIKGFDAERAYAMVRKTLMESHPAKSNWEVYNRYGYYPYDLIPLESVSQTLEFCYDDYAAADFARRLGKKDDVKFFAARADNFKHLFDPTTGFMRPKDSQGRWRTPFHPDAIGHAESGTGDYTEGNAWQYTWHVQHDVPGLIRLMGGRERFLNKLDSLFVVELKDVNLPDVTGLIGQYAHGNEPSHHVAYLYALAGRPERTQELVREICDTQYHPTPEGLCGNDDCGQMSAWYMLSAMGFYPVDPVSGQYVFGAPQISSATLRLADGKQFVIEARNLSKENLYVKEVWLNGKRYTKPTLSHADIVRGGRLVFVMGGK